MDPRQFQGEEVMKEVVPLIRDCDAIDDIYVRVGEGLTGVQYVVDKIRSVVNKGSGKEERTLKPKLRRNPRLSLAALIMSWSNGRGVVSLFRMKKSPAM
ncbi:MAG: hypothetical protein R2688_02990 [Fimbriimonadaceae bacterium]